MRNEKGGRNVTLTAENEKLERNLFGGKHCGLLVMDL